VFGQKHEGVGAVGAELKGLFRKLDSAVLVRLTVRTEQFSWASASGLFSGPGARCPTNSRMAPSMILGSGNPGRSGGMGRVGRFGPSPSDLRFRFAMATPL